LHEIIASYPSDVIISEITFIETLRVPVQLRMEEFVFTDINKSSHHKLAAAKCMYLTYVCVKNADMKYEKQPVVNVQDANCII
jgi:hypothetical protein